MVLYNESFLVVAAAQYSMATKRLASVDNLVSLLVASIPASRDVASYQAQVILVEQELHLLNCIVCAIIHKCLYLGVVELAEVDACSQSCFKISSFIIFSSIKKLSFSVDLVSVKLDELASLLPVDSFKILCA